MKTALFGIFFVGFWSFITLIFDGLIVTGMVRQQQAASYPTVTGRITQSDVSVNYDSDGNTYRADIHFTYEVDGVVYEGDRYRYGQIGTSSRSSQVEVTKQFPVEGEVMVHYNPKDPSDAVLVTGVEGMDLFMCLFLTPFNVIMIGGWFLLGSAAYRRIMRPPAGGVPVIRRQGRVHIRLPRFSPLAAGLVTALGISFVSVFAVGLFTGFNPPLEVMFAVWVVVLIAAAFVTLRARMAAGSGAKDLVIDEQRGAVSLPRTFGRKADVVVPIPRVRGVRVERITHHGSEGGTSYTWAPTLIYEDDAGAEQEAKLADWLDDKRAESLAKFIRSWLALPDADAMPGATTA